MGYCTRDAKLLLAPKMPAPALLLPPLLLLLLLASLSASSSLARAPPPPCGPYGANRQLVPPPPANAAGNASALSEWLAGVRQLRSSCRAFLGLDQPNASALFDDVPGLKWTQTAYVQTQMHPWDRLFYDPEARQYTVGRWLADLKVRFGGIDGALVWPTYPMLGFDDRNQYDMIEALPGGFDGLRKVVDELHASGVHGVLWPYNPWDTPGFTTRRTSLGATQPESLAALLVKTGADGFNGDTMRDIPEDYFGASVRAGRPAAMQAEGGASLQSLAWTTLGWGEVGGWGTDAVLADPSGPPLAFYKLLQPRRMTNVCRRNDHDRRAALQAAWFNGIGYEAWENLWGCMNLMTPRDGEATRRVARLLRYFGARHFFQTDDWEPHTPTLLVSVKGSRFPRRPATEAVAAGGGEQRSSSSRARRSRGQCDDGGEVLWTFVERSGQNFTSTAAAAAAGSSSGSSSSSSRRTIITIDANAYQGCVFYDVYSPGAGQLEPAVSADGRTLTLALPIEPFGYGGILATANKTSRSGTDDLGRLLAEVISGPGALPLGNFSDHWAPLAQHRVPAPPTKPLAAAPPGTIAVHGTAAGSPYRFISQGARVTANAFDDCPEVQYEWEPVPTWQHDHLAAVESFFIDRAPVSCSRFAAYLETSGYDPANGGGGDARGFLRGWPDWKTGQFPPGNATTPVTSVSYSEAKAFCHWAGGRLPTSVEWQYAAQGGNSSLVYPWGRDDDPTRRPSASSGPTAAAPADSEAYAARGASPSGMVDVVGNVWQWTSDEFQDERNRFAVVRGGSRFDIRGKSLWYAPSTESRRLDRYSKYMLMADAWERVFTIGFRCAYDWKVAPRGDEVSA